MSLFPLSAPLLTLSLSSQVNGSVTVFGPLLVKSIGYTSLQATLLLTPGGATTCISIYIFALLATSTRISRIPYSRTILLVLSCVLTIIGAIMCWKGNWAHKAVPLAGYYLLPTFGAPFVLLLGWSTANVAGGTKQVISSAAIFVGYNLVRSCCAISSGYPIDSFAFTVGKHRCIVHIVAFRSKTPLSNHFQNRDWRHVRHYRTDAHHHVRHGEGEPTTGYGAVFIVARPVTGASTKTGEREGSRDA